MRLLKTEFIAILVLIVLLYVATFLLFIGMYIQPMGSEFIIFIGPVISSLVPVKPLNNKMSDKEFFEWFVGFCDGEATFTVYLRKDKSGGMNFAFKIELHVKDIEVLNFIKERLGCGTVTMSQTRDSARFAISGPNDLINVLIPIFEKFSLNTTKYLDYLVFKEVLELYKEKMHLKAEGQQLIKDLLSNFNNTRTDFTMPADHKINITPYWLLGLIEGEGNFIINKTAVNSRALVELPMEAKDAPIEGTKTHKFRPNFTIALTASQKPVLDAIKIFIDQLGRNPLCPDLDIPRCGVNFRKAQSTTTKPMYALVISDVYFIYHFFIPFLNDLKFLTIKELNFKDWSLGLEVLVRGLHLTAVGKNFLFELISGMNRGRSFSPSVPGSGKIDSKTDSMANIDILSQPPLYEFGAQGAIRVISNKQWVTGAKFFMLTPYFENKETLALNVQTDSIKPLYLQSKSQLCAFFGLSDVTIYKYINNGSPLFNPKTKISYTITKIF